MGKLLFILLFSGGALAWGDDTLTASELQWLRAGWPVLTYAEKQGLDIDIVVHPASTSSDVPFAMGFADGRCQLVLSMRGNPDADAILANVPPAQIDAVIEAITAHEVAHCWRHRQGVWHQLPAGFMEKDRELQSDELARRRRNMSETRLEEGFADLVGLAWAAQHHPDQYVNVQAWLWQLRKNQPVDGSFHDTRLWVQMASSPAAFDAAQGLFEQAHQLWEQGLAQEDRTR